MIESKNDLKIYLQEDKKALYRKTRRPAFYDDIWKFEIALRKCEYYNNVKGLFHKFQIFLIPLNVFGKGLAIVHVGPIIVHSAVRVGDYCRIHVGVNIGTAAGPEVLTPKIGNCVYIGPGAKIFGNIQIADYVAIGANAVVNKDILTPSVSVGGIPAKIISDKGSKGTMYDPAS